MDTQNPKLPALAMTRLLWFAMLLGQVVFLIIIGVVLETGGADEEAGEPMLPLTLAAAAAVIIAAPMAFVMRGQIFKMNWQGDRVTERGFVTGNTVCLAILEGAAFFALVTCLINENLIPGALIAAVAMGAFVLAYPKASALEPHGPDLGARTGDDPWQ